MDEIEELLPGLEEFLTITLASENLSHFAEERRQFFLERLDIVKLPPTLPPREGRVLPPELLKETEQSSGVPTSHSTPDFAATQREISRSFVESSPNGDDEVDGAEASPVKGVKVYDDIDPNDSGAEQVSVFKGRPLSDIQPEKTSDNESDDNEESALYEIPVARQQLSADSNSQSYGADGSSIATGGSTEELPDDVLDTTLVALSPIPPPLPPRRDIKFSDSGSRNSINFEDKPPELPFRPPLPKRNELNARSDKSDRSEKSNNSDPELSADGDSTSYESFEEEEQHDADLMNKLSVQLPKKPKKRMALKKSKKLSGSRSSSQWEISVPFRKLENIDISGELYYKGKLRWNRRIVAISNGCLAMYKPDKDARPSLVIPLTGYEASIIERDGRKGFELKMFHQNADCHSFSVDFKEWAALWMEHINGCSKGQPPAKYHTHLARTFSGDIECVSSATTSGSKLSVIGNNSAELEYDEIEASRDLHDDLFIKERDDCDSIKSSPVESLSNTLPRKPATRHFQSEKSPLHSKRRTLPRSPKLNPFGLSPKEKTISATVKDILRRRQKAMYTVQSLEPCEQVGRYTPTGDSRPNSQKGQVAPEKKTPPNLTLPATAMTLSRWDWKGVFYNWSLPLDQLILAFRRTDLTGSTSNLSTGSEAGSEDSLRSKIKGNKVMRMGSFAFRATQFFENIGKGTKGKKKSQTSGATFRHSGDFTTISDGILEEPPMSHLTSNLIRSKANATSDSNLHSAFIDSHKLFSLPPAPSVTHSSHHWEGADEETNDFVDVTHKGYLHIFSSFNKRRWGKRWCLVRENMFECYKTAGSKQCELNFLLKPCKLRRAIAETNSERGLMILESGREKITVEPLSKEEMGQWVQVLLIETSTPNVPEGLEEFVKDSKSSDGDSSSVMSFTVLKQWDMDCLVPTKNPSNNDYNEPVETTSKDVKQQTAVIQCEPAVHSTTVLNNSSSDSVSQSVSISVDSTNKMSNGSSAYPKNKHATDSGFYSVKGANSDTDSSQEGGDLDFAFASQDSPCFYNSQHTSTFSQGSFPTSPCSAQESCLNKDHIHGDTPADYPHSNKLHIPSSSSHCVQLSHSSTSLSLQSPISHQLASSTSESHLSALATANSKNHSYLDHKYDSCVFSPTNSNLSKGHSKSASAVSKTCKSASSSLTVLSPSGEEYSVVLKRSERSSKSPESGGELSSSLSSTSNSRPSSRLEHNEAAGNDEHSFPTNYSEQQTCSLAQFDNDSSYYEPICSLYPSEDTAADLFANLTDASTSNSDNSVSQLPALDVDIENLPPPIPTSPIPDLIMAPSFPVNASWSAIDGNLKTTSPSLPMQPALEFTKFSESSKTNNGKGRKDLSISIGDDMEVSEPTHQTLCNGDSSAPDEHNCDDDDVFFPYEPPLSPTSDTISAVIDNPKSTPEELKKMRELLKQKQAEIKRKRLAVHDKHQRVSSDEERLACEKEIATLERAADSTDLDIRTIQNHLDAVHGQNLEMVKATQVKLKLLSKKRKAKKKS